MTTLGRDELSAQAPRMYRVALRILGNHHAAEDIVQEVCLRVLQKEAALEIREPILASTYLHRATVNCAVDRLRRENLEVDSRRKLDSGHVSEGLSAPDRVAERKELFQLAMSRVDSLPDDCRMAFVLTQLDGYTYDEAAQIEDKPRGTIASRVSRAKTLLLESLSGAHRL